MSDAPGGHDAPLPAFADKLTVMKWLGTATGVLGALLIAAHIDDSGWAFAFFFVSSAVWATAGVVMREPSLWSLNLVYMAIDAFGIVRWLF